MVLEPVYEWPDVLIDTVLACEAAVLTTWASSDTLFGNAILSGRLSGGNSDAMELKAVLSNRDVLSA
jgi:hypothetical protein